jgi:hypothetical protein
VLITHTTVHMPVFKFLSPMALALLALALCAATLPAACAAPPPPPLPALRVQGPVTVSGISSGADFAPQFLVAFSDRVAGSGSFAGQAYGCAVMHFAGDADQTCASQPASQQGPGCVGLSSTGSCPCIGCPGNDTVVYDHCKKTPEIVDLSRLRAWAQEHEQAGRIAELSNLASARVYTYRGTKDVVYLPGSVNLTGDFFRPYLASPSAQILFQANIPSSHCQPTVDPHIPRDTCGNYSIGGCQNCGYDGVGEMLQFFFDNQLPQPAQGATLDPSRLFRFSQDTYGSASQQYGGLASFGFVYVPKACEEASRNASLAPCRVHVAFHGCTMSAVFPAQNTSYVAFGGYNTWADSAGFVVLYPQGGGFPERGWTTDAFQVMSGCHDGYGQTGALFATRDGVVNKAVSAMLNALGGDAFWPL